MAVAAEFHEIQPDHAQFDDFAGDFADLHPVADSNAVFADQEKIAHDRDKTLCMATARPAVMSPKRSRSTQFAGEGKTDDHDDQ